MRQSSARKNWRSRWLVRGLILVGLLQVVSCSADPAPSSPVQNGECVAPTRACNGACANLAVDPINCGTCGAVCLAGQTCQAGRCALSCVAPQIECGGLCADPASNALHCGGCNRPCAGGQICQNSTCVTGSCAAGQSLCNGACVDRLTDPLNCGACGTACQVGQSCQAGTCVGGSAGTGGGGGSTGGSGGSTGGTGGSTGGTGGSTGVGESASCPDITWPSDNGSRNLGDGITVGANEIHDGGMQVHNGSLENCAAGDQDSVDPLIEVANGGTVRNVIMGSNVGDGIHCLGSCTIENVWFPYVCDDAITILGSGTVTIRNSGFKNARDKTIQHNGTATVNIDNVYIETAGKLYRSCGDGCSSSASRTATISNIVALGVDQVAGVSSNDRVTLRNICVHRSFSICSVYEPGTSDETETGVNSSNEGPNTNCIFTGADTHALLSRVSGIPFTTESVCGGPNGYKSGSTATSCVSGFDKCLKACMPGGYGFKEITCTNGRYAEGSGVICAMPTEATAAQNLAPSRVMGATTNVTDNDECSTEWAMGREATNNNNYCVCVHKPGYYSHDNWLAWDCQPRWW
jgi:pectate lyase